jgi:hypothetical protein
MVEMVDASQSNVLSDAVEERAQPAPATLVKTARGIMPHGKRFQPGVSGNPGGKPKSIREFQRDAARYSEEALQVLVAIMRSCDARPRDRARAAAEILNRAFGAPIQALVVGDGETIDVELPALVADLKKLLGES